MESNHIAVIALAAIISGTVLITTLVQAWIQRSKARMTMSEAPRIDGLEERLTRIEQAIEAVAVEVERISEGQRFTTKLLSERGEPARRP